jgi:hypothetical protein
MASSYREGERCSSSSEEKISVRWPVRLHGDRILVAEEEFDHAVLVRLEAGGAAQVAAEGRVFGGRERREHVPRLVELRHDPRDAREHLECRLQVVAAHVADGGAQLVDHELHPQLGGLVLDDEQHLVVIGGARALRREQAVQSQVVPVAHLAGEIQARAVGMGGWIFGVRHVGRLV